MCILQITSDEGIRDIAGGPDNYVLQSLKGITIWLFFSTRSSKAEKEPFFRQILLSDLILEWKTKQKYKLSLN